jgi:hypothetical protein
MWHLFVVALLAVAAIGLASGRFLFSTTTTTEVVRTVTAEDFLADAIRQGFKERGDASDAQANVRAAVPAVEAYFADHGSYEGLSREQIAVYDPSAASDVEIVRAGPESYCIESTEGAATASKRGPAADIVLEACPG